jgi:hypothetical protein
MTKREWQIEMANLFAKKENINSAEKVMIDYLLLKVQQKDWHGVSDAANDLREMDARKEKNGD